MLRYRDSIIINHGHNQHRGNDCYIGVGEKGLTIGDDINWSNYQHQWRQLQLRQIGYSYEAAEFKEQWYAIGTCGCVDTMACVLAGLMIGDNVIITANSVVSGKIPENAVALGNPAKVIFQRR